MKWECPTGKRQHTRESAAEAIDYQYKSGNVADVKLRSYVCEFCGKYHLTHKKRFSTM